MALSAANGIEAATARRAQTGIGQRMFINPAASRSARCACRSTIRRTLPLWILGALSLGALRGVHA